jgi:DNA-binding phage protein
LVNGVIFMLDSVMMASGNTSALASQVAEELEVSRHMLWRALSHEAKGSADALGPVEEYASLLMPFNLVTG